MVLCHQLRCTRGILLFLAIFIFLGGLSIARPAEAGLFSFLEKVFKGESVPQDSFIENSQTIRLLDAPTNADLAAAVGGGEINIEDDSALLPVVGPMGSIADVESSQKKSDKISIYVVREGDTLSGIAKLFDVSVNTIIWANSDISRGNLIKPGQTLVILPTNGVKYTVLKGDTLSKIAKKLKSDADEIAAFNGLAGDEGLKAGSEIIVPNGEFETPNYYVPKYADGGSSKQYAGYYLRPLLGGRKTQGIHGYNGVDLAAPAGTSVLAAASGDVIIAKTTGWNGGYGKYIVIQHPNGTQTLYSHLSENIVTAGWHVAQGQVIGYVGSTGKSTGPHLHFEIRGGPRNPF